MQEGEESTKPNEIKLSSSSEKQENAASIKEEQDAIKI